MEWGKKLVKRPGFVEFSIAEKITQGWHHLLYLSLCCICLELKVDHTCICLELKVDHTWCICPSAVFVQYSRLITPVVFVPLLYLSSTQGWSHLLYLSLCCIFPVLNIDPTTVAFVHNSRLTPPAVFVQNSRLILPHICPQFKVDTTCYICPELKVDPTSYLSTIQGWQHLCCTCPVLKADPTSIVFVQYSRLILPLLYLSRTQGWSYLCCICPELKVDPISVVFV